MSGITQADPRSVNILDYLESGKFPASFPGAGIRKGRCPRDGYARGWGLAFTFLAQQIKADPLYRECEALAAGRTIQDEMRRMNLYLIIRYWLPRMGAGSIIEFGSWKGGSAIFMAALCQRLNLPIIVYGLDTFTGIPSGDLTIDAHTAGDFAGVDLKELRAYARTIGLDNHLVFREGVFDQTARPILESADPVLLTHIDCDTYDSVSTAYLIVRRHMAPGGYVVFDDATTPSCLGNTEAMEELVVRRDGRHAEQAFPHFVFRAGL
jgi:predicted O-methyltransferase YrrM